MLQEIARLQSIGTLRAFLYPPELKTLKTFIDNFFMCSVTAVWFSRNFHRLTDQRLKSRVESEGSRELWCLSM